MERQDSEYIIALRKIYGILGEVHPSPFLILFFTQSFYFKSKFFKSILTDTETYGILSIQYLPCLSRYFRRIKDIDKKQEN